MSINQSSDDPIGGISPRGPVTVEIDGLGTVELDATFRDKSPAEQQAIIEDIVAQAGGSQGSGQPHASPNRNARETYQVLEKLVTHLYPGAHVTSRKRTPEHNREVGGVENSFHVTGHGLDITGLDAEERSELQGLLEARGVKLDEYKFHKVKGGGLHLHIGSTYVPDEIYEEFGFPTADGGQEAYDTAPETIADNGAPARPRSAAAAQDDSFWRMPKDWDEFGHGLALGAGDVVEGIADIPGTVLDPINTLIGRAMGHKGYVADFGKTVRETLGLPEDKTLTGDMIRGASGGLTSAGAARLLAKAGSGVMSKSLAEMGATPVRDTVGGAGAALGSGLAEEAGLPVPVQVLASVAGGAGSVLGLEKAAAQGARALDGRLGERLRPKLNQRRFEARQAANHNRAYDREITQDLAKALANLQAGKARLSRADKAILLSRVADVEASYLPYDEIKALSIRASAKAALRKALDNRHILSDEEIMAVGDGSVHGDAVADAIRKARRLRALVPEVAGKTSSSAGRFLKETLGGSLGYQVGGPLGGGIGSTLARKLTRSEADIAADKAAEVASQGPKFAKMAIETVMPRVKAMDALAKIAAEEMDAPFLAKQQASRLAAEGRALGVQNAKDDVVPAGGYRGLLYAHTGLKPSAQDAGALAMLKDGIISPEQFDMFLSAPERLMEGKAGLHIGDRLAAMADEGRLTRDPEWQGPSSASQADAAPSLDAQGQPIRSLEAYRAGAAKNIAREVDLMRQLDEIDPVRGALGGDGPGFRDSDLGILGPVEAARAAAIRAELARYKR